MIRVGSFDKEKGIWALDSLSTGKLIRTGGCLSTPSVHVCVQESVHIEEVCPNSQAMLQISQNGQKWHFLTCVRVNAFNVFLYKNTNSHCL